MAIMAENVIAAGNENGEMLIDSIKNGSFKLAKEITVKADDGVTDITRKQTFDDLTPKDSSYSAFDHDHDILVESRSWILQLVSEPRGSRSRILQVIVVDGSYWSRTITTGTGLDSYWFYNVPPGHHGYCWSYHVPPGSMTLVSPGSVMIPSGRLLYILVLACCFWSQFCDGFVTVVASLKGMGEGVHVFVKSAFGYMDRTTSFVTDGVSLNAMGGRKKTVAMVL
ncbi:hypothetical protein Tco_1517856 [Tanacetum coccineum]